MSPRARLLVALLSTAVMAYIAVGSLLGRVLGDSSYGQLALFNEVIRLVLDAYVEPVNLDRAMAGADLGLTDALDGDSSYLAADDFRAYRPGAEDADGGVGLLLTRRFSFLMVVAARPGSPAAKAGVRPGDILKTIDGRHTRPMAVPAGQRLLRGAPGSIVKLTILRAGSDPLDLELVRERLAPAPPSGKLLEEGIGYLRLPELPAKVEGEVRSQLEDLRRAGARRLVLDLRGTGFGALPEGVKVAELFVKGGVVARLAGRHSTEQVLSADPGQSAWSLPMAVLVDSGTAGAAEIVAAALLDAERCPVVGQHTFGRAGVQRAFELPEGGVVLTVAKYVSPKGTPIHGKGVEPSVPVAATTEEPGAEGAPPKDPALDKAIEVLKAEMKKAA